MKKENERLWLRLNKLRKEFHQIRYYYIGTEDHVVMTDMIAYIEVLAKRLENDE